MRKIIERDRSVVPACDVPLEIFERIVRATHHYDEIGGYKIPATSGRHGWETWVETARRITNKPLIFDPQKAGTDIPQTGAAYMKEVKEAGFDAVILFPQAGPVTAYEWIQAAQDEGLGVIVGGEMTHPGFLAGDHIPESYVSKFIELGFRRDLTGFIRPDAPVDIYELASLKGVTNFVVPGNKPLSIGNYKSLIEACGIEEPVFYAPGFVNQGGVVSEGGEAAGDRFHAIVGTAIYRNVAENRFRDLSEIRGAVDGLVSQL